MSDSLEPQPVEIERTANKFKSVSDTNDARITEISSLVQVMMLMMMIIMMMSKRTNLLISALRCPFLRFVTMSKCVISERRLKTIGTIVSKSI